MSRKSQKNHPAASQPAPQPQPATLAAAPGQGGQASRRGLIVAAGAAVVAAAGAGAWFAFGGRRQAETRPELLSAHAPTMGPATAKVHIVEFLDPACETCAAFYPHVKKLMADNPGRIKLSIRHVPFHQGSEHVVRVLEAARGQDKYWETLQAVFASQERWTVNHRVYPERVWPFLEGIGLDLERVRRDMNAADIAARIEKDTADAQALNVTKTPEYFVNGRPMPRFGLEELQGLVKEELRSAYR